MTAAKLGYLRELLKVPIGRLQVRDVRFVMASLPWAVVTSDTHIAAAIDKAVERERAEG
jgi:hypothetical protein